MAVVLIEVSGSVERLDRFIAREVQGLSRSAVQRLIASGAVTVNGAPTKASYVPAPGDLVRVELPAEEAPAPQPEAIPLSLLYEDAHLLVVNKPAGLVVHPGAGRAAGTLVNALLAHRPELAQRFPGTDRPGIVHRLDRDTSGVMVVAADADARRALLAQFKGRDVDKRYLALVYGEPQPGRGAIEAPIGRDPLHRTRMAVVAEGGRPARTEYTVVARLARGRAALVEAQLLTGRTHQIRVHLAAIGHPVVGDAVYGYRRGEIAAPRILLHSWRLSLAHPVTGERMTFEAPLPEDMAAVLARLRAEDVPG